MRFDRIFRAYLLPAAVFQSVAIAGGYATGRETVEYFTQFGSLGGLLGNLVAVLGISIVLALSYEFARITRAYDYRSFFRALIGPVWPAFEFLYIVMFLIVLSVIASASGSIISEEFGFPPMAGVGGMLVLITILAFFGREVIGRVLTFWSLTLYAVFAAFFYFAFSTYDLVIASRIGRMDVAEGWLLPALKYAMYTTVIIPAVLFATRGIETRTQALLSGFLSGLFCQLPSFLLHFSFLAGNESVLGADVPLKAMINQLAIPGLALIYAVALFGTFVETGIGFVQGIIERLDRWAMERFGRTLPRSGHVGAAIAGVTFSAFIAQLGIQTLISTGYGTMSWGFLVVYVIPLLTVGVWRMARDAGNGLGTGLPLDKVENRNGRASP